MLKKTVTLAAIATLTSAAALASPIVGTSANPTAVSRDYVQVAGKCNPCKAKDANACNPCKPKCNPCAAENPCNPCAAENPCNPCAAKNPCNPCAAKKGCNPCKPE